MDSTGNRRRSARKMERDAAEEKKRTKWTVDEAEIGERQRKHFSRLIPSSSSDGMTTMIGQNDIIKDFNLPKIQVFQEPEVNPEIKKEEPPSDEEEREVEQSTTGFQFELPVKEETSSEDGAGGTDQQGGVEETEEMNFRMDSGADIQYSTFVLKEDNGEVGPEDAEELMELEATSSQNQVPFDVREDDSSDQVGEVKDNEGAGGSGNTGGFEAPVEENSSDQMECMRCPVLEKKLEEKDQRIRESEAEKSQKQRIEQLSKELADSKSATSSMAGNTSIIQGDGDTDAITDGRYWSIYRAIMRGESKEEIERLVKMGGYRGGACDGGNSLLHVAARSGRHELVQYFVSIGIDVDDRNSDGSTPLMEAAKSKGDSSEVIDVLIKNGADLKATNSFGETALFIAIKAGKTVKEIEKLCFEDFLSYKSLNIESTVLHQAAEAGNLEALRYFLSLMPDKINAKDVFKRTPFMRVPPKASNFWPMVNLLLENGADINCGWDEWNVLHFAIRNQSCVKDLKELVAAGATWKKEKILHFCVQSGHIEAIKYFISGGAIVNGMDERGSTPLIEAVAWRRHEAVDILIENGALGDPSGVQFSAEVDVFEKLSRLGFSWNEKVLLRCASCLNLEGVRYCVQKGVDVNAKDWKGETALFHAIKPYSYDMEMLEHLVEMGANVNAVNMEGFSLLHVATKRCFNLKILKRLISFGATWADGVVGSGKKKESILHAAVNGSHAEVVQFFVSEGVDVNCRDSDGCTPLLHAAKKGAGEEVLRVLVKGRADVNAKDNNGRNAVLLGARGNVLGLRDGEFILPELQVLVELGCDWRVPADDGETVLSCLENGGDSELLRYFKSLG